MVGSSVWLLLLEISVLDEVRESMALFARTEKTKTGVCQRYSIIRHGSERTRMHTYTHTKYTTQLTICYSIVGSVDVRKVNLCVHQLFHGSNLLLGLSVQGHQFFTLDLILALHLLDDQVRVAMYFDASFTAGRMIF